jgi:hypothetical protein
VHVHVAEDNSASRPRGRFAVKLRAPFLWAVVPLIHHQTLICVWPVALRNLPGSSLPESTTHASCGPRSTSSHDLHCTHWTECSPPCSCLLPADGSMSTRGLERPLLCSCPQCRFHLASAPAADGLSSRRRRLQSAYLRPQSVPRRDTSQTEHHGMDFASENASRSGPIIDTPTLLDSWQALIPTIRRVHPYHGCKHRWTAFSDHKSPQSHQNTDGWSIAEGVDYVPAIH